MFFPDECRAVGTDRTRRLAQDAIELSTEQGFPTECEIAYFLSLIFSLGIEFCSFSEQMDTSTPTGKMIFTVLGAVAELERSLIAERVRAGIRNARHRGAPLHAANRFRIRCRFSRTAQPFSRGFRPGGNSATCAARPG